MGVPMQSDEAEAEITARSTVLALKDATSSGRPIVLGNEIVVQLASSSVGVRLAIVCASGRVYTSGDNSQGQLGHGHMSDVPVHQPQQVKALDRMRVMQVACGGEHTLFRTDEFKVYASGSNKRGQAGLEELKVYTLPAPLPGLDSISYIAAGKSHSAALTINGRVYMWGANNFGQLGLDNRESDVITPTWLLPSPGRVVLVSCGLDFTAFLTADRKLYMCGNNRHGQLGQDFDGFTHEFCEVAIEAPLVSVACGGIHTVALTDKGKVFVWGGNACGQLGFRACPSITTPFHLAYLDEHKVHRVACGRRQTALVTDNGWLFKMGVGRTGLLNDAHHHNVPVKVTTLGNHLVKDVSCGSLFTNVLVERRPGEAVVEEVDPLDEVHEPSPQVGRRRPRQFFRIQSMDTFVREEFECSICVDILEKPIYQCENGHNVCRNCRPRMAVCHACRGSYLGTRNLSMESLCSRLQYKCGDCFKVMQASQRGDHLCLHCPLRSSGCKIKGALEDVWRHVQATHAAAILDGSLHSFGHRDQETSVNVVTAWDEIFVLQRSLDVGGKKLNVAVQHFGSADNSYHFNYLLHIIAPEEVPKAPATARTGHLARQSSRTGSLGSRDGAWYLKKVRSSELRIEECADSVTLGGGYVAGQVLRYDLDIRRR